MAPNLEQKPSLIIPFVLGLASFGFGIHLCNPESADAPELVLSGILISVGVIFFGRVVRNAFYRPDAHALQVADRKATVPFIERRKRRGERRASATRRWINERRHLLNGLRNTERRDQTYDRRTTPDRRVSRRNLQRWEDPSVLHPVKPSTY